MNKRNILFLNRSFYPDKGATGQLLTELCEDLSHTYNVSVIAGRPFIHKARAFQLIKKEIYKGIQIIRINNFNLPKAVLPYRITNFLSFFFLSFFCVFFLRKQHLVISETDPPIMGIVAIFLRTIYRCPFIYYCQDIYPDVGILSGKIKSAFIIAVLERVSQFIHKQAVKIITLGKDMKKKLQEKNVPEEKIRIIENWTDCNAIYPMNSENNPFKEKYHLIHKFIIMYSGNLGFLQDLDKVIDLAEMFRGNEKILFVIVGEGSSKSLLEKIVRDKEAKNVKFIDYQPKEMLRYSLGAADLHLITLKKGLAGTIIPSKFYGILASGKPYIAAVDSESEVANITQSYKTGIWVEPGSVDHWVKAIQYSFQNKQEIAKMGERGRALAKEFFDKRIAFEKFHRLLKEVLESLS